MIPVAQYYLKKRFANLIQQSMLFYFCYFLVLFGIIIATYWAIFASLWMFSFSITGMFTGILALILYKKKANHTFIANLILATSLILCTLTGLVLYPFTKVYIFWVSIIPLGASMLLNWKYVVIWGLLSILFIILSIIIGPHFPVLFTNPTKTNPLIYEYVASGLLAIIYFLFVFYNIFHFSNMLNLIFSNRDKLKEARKQVINREKEKDMFFQNLNAELKNPIETIENLLKKMKENNVENPQKLLSLIDVNINDLKISVNEITDISKILNNTLEFQCIAFNIKKDIENTFETSKLAYLKEGVNARLVFDSKFPLQVEGDPYRFKQILSNLLSNSFKHTNYGEVKMIASIEKTSDHNYLLRIDLIDTGKGMDPSYLEATKKSLKSIDASNFILKDLIKKGLELTKNLIMLQKGALRIESQLNVGTSIEFVMPFKRATLDISNAMEIPDTFYTHKYNYLIVEENKLNLTVIKKQLDKKFFNSNAYTYSSINESFEAIRTSTFDFIILGIQLHSNHIPTLLEEIKNSTNSSASFVFLIDNSNDSQLLNTHFYGLNKSVIYRPYLLSNLIKALYHQLEN